MCNKETHVSNYSFVQPYHLISHKVSPDPFGVEDLHVNPQAILFNLSIVLLKETKIIKSLLCLLLLLVCKLMSHNVDLLHLYQP